MGPGRLDTVCSVSSGATVGTSAVMPFVLRYTSCATQAIQPMTGALANPVNRPGSVRENQGKPGKTRENRGLQYEQESGSALIVGTHETRHTSVQRLCQKKDNHRSNRDANAPPVVAPIMSPKTWPYRQSSPHWPSIQKKATGHGSPVITPTKGRKEPSTILR
jgi:hypothetical protein